MLEDLELPVDDARVCGLTHVPDHVGDQVLLVSVGEIIPLHQRRDCQYHVSIRSGSHLRRSWGVQSLARWAC